MTSVSVKSLGAAEVSDAWGNWLCAHPGVEVISRAGVSCRGIWLLKIGFAEGGSHLVRLFPVGEQVPGLAAQHLAQPGQRAEPDRPGPPVFED